MITDRISISEIRYRRLFEAARDGILLVDPHTSRIVDVNPFLEEFLGYSRAEFIDKELYEIGLLKDKNASQVAFRELLQNGFIRYELPLRTKDGREVDAEFVSNVYDEGDHQIIQCNVRDVSMRKRTETALRQSEERFKLVTRAVSDVIWDWDLATDNFWWSDAFMTTFGYITNENEQGRSAWKSRIHPDDRRRVIEGIYAAVDSGAESWTADYCFKLREGGYASVRDSGYILHDGNGTAVRMVGGIRDVTEQKHNEEQAVRAQRMESIGTLAGGIAHDLNNVLTPVLMSIELLKDEAVKGPDRCEILETIQLSCRRGADLVRQVLTFARGLDGERVEIRVRNLISEFKTLISESFPRNIRILSKVPDDLWMVTGDPTQLHQVLLNLAVNARDAMPHGGTLTLSAGNVSIDPQVVGGSRETSAGRHVMLQVSDTGSGITASNRDRIFEPFFTTKKIGDGTGFGLAIVHTIVKNHGGFLTVDTEVGRGTTFKIYFPADPALRTASSLPPFKANLPQGHGELILVADDEFAICQMTQRTLQSFGYRVIIARNGADAVSIYSNKSREIALVVTDMMMPVMDGAAAVAEMRRINPLARIVAVSGMDISEDTKSCVDDFLAKPYSALNLVQMVHDVLDRPKSTVQHHSFASPPQTSNARQA